MPSSAPPPRQEEHNQGKPIIIFVSTMAKRGLLHAWSIYDADYAGRPGGSSG